MGVGPYKKKQRFLHHIPGPVAGVFLCAFDDASDHSKTIHIEAAVEDVVSLPSDEVCVTCLQNYLRTLIAKE